MNRTKQTWTGQTPTVREAGRVAPLSRGAKKTGGVFLGVLVFAFFCFSQSVFAQQGTPIQFVSATNIPIPSSAAVSGILSNNGIQDLVVHPGTGGISVLMGNGDGTFGTPQPITSAANIFPFSMALADVNGDGHQDLIAADNSGKVYVFLGNGDGTFQAPASYNNTGVLSSGSTPIVVINLKGAGHKPDIVAANIPNNTITIFFNNGDGTYGTAQVITVNTGSGQQVEALAVGEFNNSSGLNDIVVGTTQFGSATANFAVILHNTTSAPGTFTQTAVQVTPAGVTDALNMNGIAAVDADGDGNLDLLVSEPGRTTNRLLVLVGNGGGVLAAPTQIAAVSGALATGTFAKSQQPGIVVQNTNDGFTFVNNLSTPGNLNMQVGGSYVAGPFPAGILAADWNGDGFADVAVIAENGINLFFNNKSAAFLGAQSFSAGTSPQNIVAAPNFVCGNETDVAVLNAISGGIPNVSFLSTPANGLNGTLGPVTSFPVGASKDTATALTFGTLLSGTGAASCVGGDTPFLAAATFNTTANKSTITVILGGHTPAVLPLTTPITFSGAQITAIAVGDFNGDGNTDLAVALSTGGVKILTGDGTGCFGNQCNAANQTVPFVTSSAPVALSVADFNGDNKPDLAVLDQTSNAVIVLLNNTVSDSSIQFTSATSLTAPSVTCFDFTASMAVGDFDNKNGPDIAVITPCQQELSIFLNGGAGTSFTPVTGTPVQITGLTGELVAGDFNADGNIDLAFTNGGNVGTECNIDDALIVLQGNGDGTFQISTVCSTSTTTNPNTGLTFSAGNSANSVAVGDFNGDGRMDAAVADGSGNMITLLLSQAPPVPGIGFVPGSITFTSVSVGSPASQTFTVSNSGTGSLLFGITPFSTTTPSTDPFTFDASACPASPSGSPTGLTNSLASGASCVVTATFTPTVGGSNSGGLTFLDNAPSGAPVTGNPGFFTHTFSLSGTAVAPSNLAVTLPSSPSFGSIGSALTYSVKLTNSSSAVVSNVTVVFTFSPAVTFGSLTGLTPPCSTTPAAGATPVSTFQCNIGILGPASSGILTLTITPNTAGPLTLAVNASDTQSDTGQATATTTISALAPAIINVTETIHVTDSFPDVFTNEMITVHDAVTVTPLINVIAPVAFFSPSVEGFGSVAAGTSGTQTITVSNIGEGQTALSLTSAAISPASSPFTLGPVSCSNGAITIQTTLPSGGACVIAITYQAPAPIPNPAPTATLTFTDNAALSNVTSTASGPSFTQAVTLSGSGASSTSPQPPANVPVTDNESIGVNDSPGLKIFQPSVTSLVSSANPSQGGAQVTFTATVKSVPAGGVTPTGSVTFFVGATQLGAAPVTLSNGAAMISTSTLIVGNNSITASYSGDSVYAPSTPPLLTEIVSGGTSATDLTAAPNPSQAGQSVTFTATVTSVPTGSGTPTGNVTFFDGVNPLGTSALSSGSTAVATFSTSTLLAGTHPITAIYNGSTSFSTSTSSIVPEVVIAKPTATAISSSLNPAENGQSVIFTATVTSTAGGTPTGSITFNNGAIALGTVNLTSGVATISTTTLALGSDTITASYGGDTIFATSTSSALVENIVGFGPAPTGLSVTVGNNLPISLTVFNTAGSGLSFTFTCGVTPVNTNASCGGFSPATIATGTPQSGTTLNFSFETTGSPFNSVGSPANISNRHPLTRFAKWTLEFFEAMAALFAIAIILRRRVPRWRSAFVVCLVIATVAVAVSSCQAPPIATPSGNYTITVTGTSGTTQISTSMTVNVTKATN